MVLVVSDLYFTKGLIGHLVTKQPGTIAANIGFQMFFFSSDLIESRIFFSIRPTILFS